MRRWVLGTSDAAHWRELLARIPRTDVYFLPEYHRLFEVNGDGVASVFVAAEGEALFFYPLFIRPIDRVGAEVLPEPWYDIETVNGYTGPLSSTDDPAFLRRAWAEFDAWCAERRVIAEFVRFNPALENYRLADAGYQVVVDRDMVVQSLPATEDELWDAYPRAHRNLVFKALDRGLCGSEESLPEYLAVFRALYDRTMEKVEASEYFFYSDAYFDHLATAFPENLKLFLVRDDARPVAALLCFLHEDRMHAHIAGSDEASRGSSPNNLLYHTAAAWGVEHGYRSLHLGGGRSPRPDDALFRFKQSISPHCVPYRLGKRVRQGEVYDDLCGRWMRQKGVTERPGYFFCYRLDVGFNLPLVAPPKAQSR